MEVLTLTLTLTVLAISGAILAIRYRNWLSGNRGPLLLTAATVFFVLAFLVLFYRPPGTDIGVEQHGNLFDGSAKPPSQRALTAITRKCRSCHGPDEPAS